MTPTMGIITLIPLLSAPTIVWFMTNGVVIVMTSSASVSCPCDSSHLLRNISLPSSVASPRLDGSSDAVRIGDFLYVSQQIGEDLLTRKLVGDNLKQECQLALNNTLTILKFSGCSYRNVVVFSWQVNNIKLLQLIDEVQGSLGLNIGHPDTVYAAGRGYGVGYSLPQNASFVFDYVAYGCTWSYPAQDHTLYFPNRCTCQKPLHHDAWDLPENVSTPVPPNKCFRRVSRGGRNVYLTGTVGQSYLTGAIVPGGLEAQLNKSLDNVALQLAEAGCTFDDVVHVETLLKNLSLVFAVNESYERYFGHQETSKRAFLNSQRLVNGMKMGADIQLIVDARDCSFTKPEYTVI